MKKSFLRKLIAIAVMFIFATSAYAAKSPKSKAKPKSSGASRPGVWVLDFADAHAQNESFNYWHDDNSGGSGYSLNMNFSANTIYSLPRKGEKVRFTGIVVSDIDLPYLTLHAYDNSQGEYVGLTWVETVATDIKAGVPFEINTEIEIREQAKGEFFASLQYDLCWGDYASIPKVEEPASFTFSRKNNSTDSYLFKTISAEKWTIDICDSDTGSERFFNKEDWAYASDKKYDELFLGVYPRKGDFIELNISGVSDTDLPLLNIQICDMSGDFKDVMDGTKFWWDTSLHGIKAGVPFKDKIIVPVTTVPTGSVTVRMHYDAEWEKAWRKTPDVGESATIKFERCKNSFDITEQCEKIGVAEPPKVYKLDLIDSNLGSEFNLDWDDNEWAKSYRNSVSFRNLIRGDKPKPGNFIIIPYNMTFSEDIPYLSMQVFDGSKANTWHDAAYKPNYFEFKNVKAGEPVKGKMVVKVVENPLFDVNIQFYYDSEWQLASGCEAVGKPAEVSLTRVTESTNTVPPRPAKSYKVDISKLAKDLFFRSFDGDFNETKNPSEIKYYSADLDLTALFKKDDLPRAGDTVEIVYTGALSDDYSGIAYYLWETNAYIWWKDLSVKMTSDDEIDVTPMNIQADKKFKFADKLVLTEDADLSIGLSVICVK